MQSSPPLGRDAAICQRYLTENISIPRLAADVGLSEVRVKQILANAGISKRDKSFDLEEEVDKTYSNRHVALGKFLIHTRTFSLGVDRSYFAKTKLGWSVPKLASIEKGTYNITLIDMVDLAAALNTTLEALLAASAPFADAPKEDSTNQSDN